MEPHKRLRIRQFCDERYGEVTAILTDDDALDRICVIQGANHEFIATVVARPEPGFFQIDDGRLFPQDRVLGVLFAAVREEEAPV